MIDLNQQNLFSILQIGDRKVQQLKNNVYMIVGLTKNGKSCFFNHILGKPMIGVTDPEDQQRIIYDPKANYSNAIQDYAVMGSSPVSVTLAPNIADLSPDCSLIDMLGFQQNRNEKSALSVSYFLLSCFEKAKTVKFIVVIASQNLLCVNLNFICGSFNELIEMFALSKFDQSLKKSFMDSITVVVSSAKENLDYYKKRLSVIVNQLGNKSIETIKNRVLIMQMLQQVVSTGRVECFFQAKLNCPNDKSTILEKLNRTGWKEFEVRRAKELIGEDAVVIPFKQDFRKLSQAFVIKFKDAFTQKISTLLQISSLFTIYLKEIWASGRVYPLDLSKVKAYMQRCLNEGYCYNKDALRERRVQVASNSQQRAFLVVKKSLEIYDLSKELQDLTQNLQAESHSSFDRNISKLQQIYSRMIDCLIPAFTDNETLTLLAQIRFFLVRSFKQFIKFNRLDSYLISNSNIIIRMKDANAHQVSKRDYLSHFFQKIDRRVLACHFRNVMDLLQYEQLLEIYRTIMINEQSADQFFQIKYIRLKLHSFQLRNQINLVNNHLPEAISTQIQLIQLYTQLFTATSSSKLLWSHDYKIQNAVEDYLKKYNQALKNKPDVVISNKVKIISGNKNEKIEEVYYQTLRAINDFIELIARQNYGQFAEIMPEILQLCELARSPSLADRMFQSMLKVQSNSVAQKISILWKQALLCRRWGWFEKASMLLRSKLQYELQEMHIPSIKQTEIQIRGLEDKQKRNQLLEVLKQKVDNVFGYGQVISIRSILNAISLKLV